MTKRLLLWRCTVNRWITLAAAVRSNACQEFSFILKTIKRTSGNHAYTMSSHKKYQRMTKLAASRPTSKIMSCGITVPPLPCKNTQPSPGTQTGAMKGDYAVNSTLIFHQQSFSRGRGVIFLNSSKTIHAVHLMCKKDYDCGLKRKWVTEEYCCLFNNPSCHGNCRADKKVLNDSRGC